MSEPNERSAFEAWWVLEYRLPAVWDRQRLRYTRCAGQDAWKGWQARAALESAASATAAQSEPVPDGRETSRSNGQSNDQTGAE